MGWCRSCTAGCWSPNHAQRIRPHQADRAPRLPAQRRARDATIGLTVTRKADNKGSVSFAGVMYRAGRAWRGQSLQVAIVAGSARDGTVIRVHPIRHDWVKELGVRHPNGRPRKVTSRADHVADLPEPICRAGIGD